MHAMSITTRRWCTTVFIALALATLACMKSDYQIAQEAVDCMIRNDPDAGTSLLFLGGKDVYAKMIEQSMTRQDIVAFRNEHCE